MPANTPNGYPYPLGTDRVADGDDAIKALAEKVDVLEHCYASATIAATANSPVAGNIAMTNHQQIYARGGWTVAGGGLTVPLTGVYMLNACARLFGGAGQTGLLVFVNGGVAATAYANAAAGLNLAPAYAGTFGLLAGQVVQIGYLQPTANSVQMIAGAGTTQITARLLSP